MIQKRRRSVDPATQEMVDLVEGSRHVEKLLTKTFEKHFGATWAFERDPIQAAHLMIDHIDRKRADLGLPPPMYEVPYCPKTAQAGDTEAERVAGAELRNGIMIGAEGASTTR